MTDPALLEQLEGQQYLVLRPASDIASFWDDSRESLRRVAPQEVSYPNTGHVTLRGFHEPHHVGALKEVLTEWAGRQRQIDLRVEEIDGFPPPFQIIIARLERTSSLVDAYADLTSLLDTTEFHRIGELSLDEWVFHLSLIYAGRLSEAQWDAMHRTSRRSPDPQPAEVITSADFVWYANGVEHVDTLEFGGYAR